MWQCVEIGLVILYLARALLTQRNEDLYGNKWDLLELRNKA